MSIVGPDGRPIVMGMDAEDFSAGGLRVKIAESPENLLEKGLAGARHMAAQQAAMAVVDGGGSESDARAQAMAQASKINDPFTMEPCAFAVFMLLSREVEHRDRIIKDMAERLDALDSKTTNLDHKYPSVRANKSGSSSPDSN